MTKTLQFRTFTNHYICEACPNEWTDEMNVIQFSYCPCCDAQVEPYASEEEEEEEPVQYDDFGISITEHHDQPRWSRWHATHRDFPTSIGLGFSDRDAVRDLLEIMEDAGEISHDEMKEAMRIYGTQPYRDPDHGR